MKNLAKQSSHVIKVTGVSDELLSLLDMKMRQQHATGRAEYIRELIRRDILASEIIRPSQESVSPAEWSRQFHEWAESHKPTPNLSASAISRKSLYKERGL